MKLSKRLFIDRWIVTIDGKDYSPDKAAKKLNLPIKEIDKACRLQTDDTFERHILDLIWRSNNGAGFYERIYEKDGYKLTVSMVRNYSGVSKSLAAENIRRWRSGKLTYNEMMNYDSKKSNHSKPHTIGSVPLKDMQPRKETWELKVAGSWERDNCKSDTFSKLGRPTVCGRSTKGRNLRGD